MYHYYCTSFAVELQASAVGKSKMVTAVQFGVLLKKKKREEDAEGAQVEHAAVHVMRKKN